MLVYKDCIDFNVMGRDICLISDAIGDSLSTIAEVSGVYYYLGNEVPNILAAVLAWQEFSGRDLTEDELMQVMADNTE